MLQINLLLQLILESAGGGAGMMEALICHPLGANTEVFGWLQLTQSRYYQSAHAAIEEKGAWCKV